jgi:hypothetical protein
VSFAAIIPCVASQRVFIVVRVDFVIDSVRKRLDTPSYTSAREDAILAVCLCYVLPHIRRGKIISYSVRNKDTHTHTFFSKDASREQTAV